MVLFIPTYSAIFISWKYSITRSVNSDFSIVTMHRVAIIVFQMGVVKNFRAKILTARHFMIIFYLKLCLIVTVSYIMESFK